MKLKNSIWSITLISALLFTGCSTVNAGIESGDIGSKETSSDNTGDSAASENSADDSANRISASDVFSDRDLETGYDEGSAAVIKLNGKSASCDSDAVKISGSKITITDEGTYIISGTLQDGMVVVDAGKSDKIQIVLNGAEISNSTSAALYVLKADKVFVTTAEKSENTLSNGGAYKAIDENNIDSVIYSKEDLTLNGEGSLTINAKAGHGIVSKDSLVLTSGEYSITAENHGLSGKDDVSVADGSYKIVSGKDGIHAENTDDESLGFVYIKDGTFDITSEGDGISGAAFGQIENGSFTIKTGGGSEAAEAKTEQKQDAPHNHGSGMRDARNPEQQADSADRPSSVPSGRPDMPSDMPSGRPDMPSDESEGKTDIPSDKSEESNSNDTVSIKGIKASGNLYLDGGEFEIDSEDDSLHSNNNIMITKGTYKLASGDDGIHADSDVAISDGTVNISQCYEGIEGKIINISGGDISLVSSDDGLNASGGADGSGYGGRGDSFAASDDVFISISGGTIYIDASGDGVDSNGNLTVSGGQTYVSGPSNSGNGALDYNGEANISGGTFAAASASGMAQNFGTSSTQGAMLVSTENGASGDEISLTDSDGNVLVSWKVEKDYSCVNISCPELVKGETYTLTTGSAVNEITMSDLIYGEGDEAGRGGGKGPGGMDGHKGDRDMKQI